jgi:glycosyltransferase involved in cell wall biosynthesis
MNNNSNIEPLVSILMLTYNHENYIAQAIESVLAQKTTFPFQLVIGDDCSTDRTSEICRQYLSRFPDKIVHLSGYENLGLGRNFMRSFKACSGKYVAICEGDDFWIHQDKLQIQINFLESNNDFSICFHRIMNYYPEDGSKSLSNPSQKLVSDIFDLSVKNFIVNVSCVFRNKLFDPPEWFANISTYDYAAHMINAQFGKIRFIPKTMAVYRQHKLAIWSRANQVKKSQISLDVRKNLIDFFADKPEILEGLKSAYAKIALNRINYCLKLGNIEEATKTRNVLSSIYSNEQIESVILEMRKTNGASKRIINFVKSIASFFRIHLSKLYPLPQLKLN